MFQDCSFVALGSNLGQRTTYLYQALQALERHKKIRVLALSYCYETSPWGPLSHLQRPYLNMVVKIYSPLEPEQLLTVLKAIEAQLGRFSACIQPRWASRVIDLDLLLHQRHVYHSDTLVLPHPRMGQRIFVLQPLFDLAPTLKPAGMVQSVAELLAVCQKYQDGWCRLFCIAADLVASEMAASRHVVTDQVQYDSSVAGECL